MELRSSKALFQERRRTSFFDKKILELIRMNEYESNREIKYTLKKSKIWNATDITGSTFLHYAAKHDNVEIVEFLIESGCVIDAKNNFGKTPLIESVENCSITTTTILLEAGSDIYNPIFSQNSTLHYFCHLKHIDREILQIVLEQVQTDCSHNMSVIADKLCNIDCPIYNVILLKNSEVTKIMFERNCIIDACNKDKQTALHLAVSSIDVEHVKLLLEYNADRNAMDHTYRSPLYYLYFYNTEYSDEHLQILKMLIDHGASSVLTVKNFTWIQVDSILRYGNREAIEILLGTNLDLNITDKNDAMKRTLIHILAENENPEVFRALDNRKFDMEIRNAHSQTPLAVAANNGNTFAVEYLLKRGANVNAFDDNGHSVTFSVLRAYTETRYTKYLKCAEILLNYGANCQSLTNIKDLFPCTLLEHIESMLCHCHRLDQVAIACLVVKEALGTEITERTRYLIKSSFQNYYELCQKQLSTIIDKSITLLDMLSLSELKFEQYVRNEQWISKLENLCSDEKLSFCYLYKILLRRVENAKEMIQLKVDAADVIRKIMKMENSNLHLITDKITECLSEQDLRNLLTVRFEDNDVILKMQCLNI